MIQIDWQSGIPAYDQIVQGIIRLKAVGALSPNEQLPSVRNLAVQLGVNPNTVQKSYLILENKGTIYSVAGKDSFLADTEEADLAVKNAALARLTQAADEAQRFGISEQEALDAVTKSYQRGGNYHD